MNPHTLEVILIEDNSADVYLIRRSLHEAGLIFNLRILRDGEEALRFIEKLDHGAAPDLFLLDWNLPRVHGQQILEAMGHSSVLGNTPRIVLTSSESPTDRVAVERLGAVFVSKPRTLDEFMQIGFKIRIILGVD